MRTFRRIMGRGLVLIILLCLALWIWGPYERISLHPTFGSSDIGVDIDAYLAAKEADFDDITPDTQKRVIWHGESGKKTPLAIVYIHGFSATSEEIRPVPDLVAKALGANLFYTRLAGHGRKGEALAEVTTQDWMNDAAEALEIGRRLGEDIIVIATSTGATLMAEAAVQPDMVKDVKGLVLVSPNFGLADPTAMILTLPAARYWGPVVAGKTRSWTGRNDLHDKFWTTTYPTVSLFQMAALVQHAATQNYQSVTVPALFWFSDADDVVDHRETRKVAAAWGGENTLQTVMAVSVGTGDDPNSHVIAGDILSPGQTQGLVGGILNWINELELYPNVKD
ncbi:Lysophospholipase, alpha-beta hydrolase superfamily [Shimia gijangensis]|uniref:Lysophospholipase, alpha-beta hydrolase superfamily n=1 Tax=Shimia gijangensis TaxID=1470563 RepID=A0A1M6DXD7_9RHOB|nr:alpha/beta fold hydrolase [Shimia gijangensis]SHI77789.1 Lysophospholipase, alpha-beta hydrolase superfamily [Shimia gijangensis]